MNGVRLDTRNVSEQTWQEAIEYYNKNKGKRGMDAALLSRFGVNAGAIRHRISNKIVCKTTWGGRLKFSLEEEEHLKDIIFTLQD